MDTRPIGVFDSGVGGLSILKELRKLLPKENYIFLADQKNIPYGEKTKLELQKITLKIITYLTGQRVKLVVVACNTATCYAVDFLRIKFPAIPIVGTVPAIKPAVELSKKKVIAVFSTPATSKSTYIKKLIGRYAGNVKVLNIGCAGLEDAVEKGLFKSPKTISLLKSYIEKIQNYQPDYIVLGCTHYPFLADTITKLTKDALTIDSGYAIAQRTKSMLKMSGLENEAGGSVTYFTTADPSRFSQVASALLKTPVRGKRVSLS